jgi:cholesterol oxidase
MADERPFDAVVIGSGFGGAVTALRLAKAEWRVCVLERGRPFPPGSFPRTPHKLATDGFWSPETGRHGLFETWSFGGLSALVASGLGGGSLIYANVMLRKPPETFVDDERESWPISYDDLHEHYNAVEEVQAPQRFPIGQAPYSSTPKTQAMLQAGHDLGLDSELPPLAVLFAADGDPPAPGEPIPGERTLHGAPRTTCRLCGECDLGCNFGAMNTLDHTYLTLAKAAGAQLRCLCEVTAIGHAEGGGYEVAYRQHVAARDGHDEALLDPTTEPQRTIRAHHVVLAAGTLGSTRLLLANRARLPGLSPMLGKRVSANGDYIALARDCRQDNGDWRYLDHSVGPVITASLRVGPERSDSGREYYVQDAGGPAFVEFLWQAMELPEDMLKMLPIVGRRIVERIKGERDTNLSDEVASLFGSAHASAAMLPLLGMGRDTPDGVLTLTDGRLELDWDKDGSDAHYDALRATFREVAQALGGELWEVPFARVTTVHPVGGCAMATTAREGVVDPWGEVFGHRGLHVADGAVLPGPVGPNPSFTIAAIADRFAERMIEGGRPS